MEIEFQLTKNDYKTFCKLYYKNELKKRIIIVILIPLFIGYALSGNPFRLTKFIYGTIISEFLFIGILYFAPLLVSLFKISKSILKDPEYLAKKKLRITDEGLYFETATKNGTWKWESIVSFNSYVEFISLSRADKKYYLIPKRAFSSDNEAINFLGIVQSKIIKVRGTIKSTSETAIPKPLYFLGLICLIPLIGAFVGLVFVILGITKFKDKWFTLIGVFGIVFTIIVYSSLFYASKHASIFKNGFEQLSQMQLNNLVKDIEYYKLINGQYPDSLQQLKKGNLGVFINDPIQANQLRKNNLYIYIKMGEKYLLFSSGEDGVPNTKDDLYPQLSAKEGSKSGLIKFNCKPDTTILRTNKSTNR
ncbi:MAG: type II secretion system protein GspG [Bacteroidales bacterium]|jgi:hypothetical protein